MTGIHIAKPNRIIELVISERKLLSFGRLKPTNNYFHYNYPTWTRSHPKLSLSDPDAQEGVDYFTLTYENRSINFDTITLPQGHVVTGVRFALSKGHLRLEVRSTEFDFETGLNAKSSSQSIKIDNDACEFAFNDRYFNELGKQHMAWQRQWRSIGNLFE